MKSPFEIDEITFVCNRGYAIVDMGDFYFVYLPVSGEQATLLGLSTVNPCARIVVRKSK